MSVLSSFFTASQSNSPLSSFVVIAVRPGGGWNAQLGSLPGLLLEAGVEDSEMRGIDFFDLFFLCFVVVEVDGAVDIGFRICNERCGLDTCAGQEPPNITTANPHCIPHRRGIQCSVTGMLLDLQAVSFASGFLEIQPITLYRFSPSDCDY